MKPNYKHSRTLKGHTRGISCVKFSPNGDFLASSGSDRAVRVWDLEGNCYATLKGHKRGVSDISWCPESKFLCSASDDRTVIIWDVHMKKHRTMLTGHQDFVISCSYSKQGDKIASGDASGNIIIWSVQTAEVIHKKSLAHSDPVISLDFNAAGTLLCSSSYDGTIRLWNSESGDKFGEIQHPSGKNTPFTCVKFAPNGKFFLAASLDNTLRLYKVSDHKSQKAVKDYNGHRNQRFGLFANFLTTHKDKFVVCGSEEGKVHIWNLQTKEEVQILGAHDDVVVTVACHPERNLIATGAFEKDKTIKLWEHDEGGLPQLDARFQKDAYQQ